MVLLIQNLTLGLAVHGGLVMDIASKYCRCGRLMENDSEGQDEGMCTGCNRTEANCICPVITRVRPARPIDQVVQGMTDLVRGRALGAHALTNLRRRTS